MDTEDSSHAQLVAAAVSGQSSALQRLLQHYRVDIESYIQRHLPAQVRSQFDVQDVMQDVYFEAFRRIHTFAPHLAENFDRWLLTIARHRIVDLVRHYKAAKRGGGRSARAPGYKQDSSTMALLEDLRIYDKTPSGSAMSHELVEQLRGSLAGLPPLHRQALEWRYLEQHPVAEIAARLQRTEGAVHVLCHRSLQALRNKLLGSLRSQQ